MMGIEKQVSLVYTQEKQGRLDQFLAQSFSEYSRSFFQKLIAEGNIKVNGLAACKPAAVLRPNDALEVSFPLPHECSVRPQQVPFGLVDVQEDFILTNKPAGLLVHHACSNPDEATLVSGVMHLFRELEHFEDKDRPGIVHRIDKDTSGLVLVTRTTVGKIEFSRKFADRQISKTYLALVKGRPPKSGTIDYPISRSTSEPHKMTHASPVGREALTHYRTLAYYKDAALVEVKIITGRTHQIRVHFAAIGHGLLGDSTYGVPCEHIARQALHAWKISFTHKGKDYSYRVKPAPDFLGLVARLNSAESF
jgi:23S rRNA pseudouridine1911/1915/1917 synthase